MIKPGALPVLLFVILSFSLALPNQANIGVKGLEYLESRYCDYDYAPRNGCLHLELAIILMKLFAIFLTIATIGYVFKRFGEGNFFFAR
jgi:hypothetical protein